MLNWYLPYYITVFNLMYKLILGIHGKKISSINHRIYCYDATCC